MKKEVAKPEKIQLPVELEPLAKTVSKSKIAEVMAVLGKIFSGVANMKKQIDNITVANENDKFNMKAANQVRLEVKRTRLEAAKIHWVFVVWQNFFLEQVPSCSPQYGTESKCSE